MMYDDWREVEWDSERWPNFSAAELACRCGCGEYYHSPADLDSLQGVRTGLGVSVNLSSAHRCDLHNARVGGAPFSEHKMKIAFDIKLQGHDPETLLRACIRNGFDSFGYYGMFLHTDRRPGRRWFGRGQRGKRLWVPVLESLRSQL